MIFDAVLDRLQQPTVSSVVVVLVLFPVITQLYRAATAYLFYDLHKFPIVNGINWWDPWGSREKDRYVHDSQALLDEGFSKAQNGFRLQTDNTLELVLSPAYANELKDHPSLSLSHHVAEVRCLESHL